LRFLQILYTTAFIAFVCGNSCVVKAQILVNDNYDAVTLTKSLLGKGVTILNARLSCPANANGVFAANATNLGLDSGIVLTNGTVVTNGNIGVDAPATAFASTNNNADGDTDLSVLAGQATHDACVLEFDFCPRGDSISFTYVFGSEEYPEYECSIFNDVFGFFISGPGYATPQNIALVPGTQIPVCINSVNDDSPPNSDANCRALGPGSPFTQYYVNNQQGAFISYNGFTKPLVAVASVVPCDTYHLKMGVADASDFNFDSGVFLKAGSISSNAISILPDAVTMCDGDSVRLTANGGNNYIWSPAEGLSCTNCGNPITTSHTDITYFVAGFGTGGCADTATVTVHVIRHVVTSADSAAELCAGSNTILHAANGISYIWKPSTGLSSDTVATPICSPQSNTVYTVFITENECFTDSFNVSVVVNEALSISLDTMIEDVAGSSIKLSPSFTGPATTFRWEPTEGLSCTDCAMPLASPTSATTYTLTALTNAGCSASAAERVDVTCSEKQLFIPNTFTPNNDGVNDRFYVSGVGIDALKLFSIYDRWGELLFTAENIPINNPAAGWDGTYKGQRLPPDIYVYFITATCETGKKLTYKGNIALVK
jgi:gliding motility-associated-like protein